ncbi:MAG: CBS domain-containing protein [Candidatus Nanoarchaeia archaeon]|nr:CBS domain-containing protein [Candidatus Nanoarchaeia archaeon]
MQVKDVMNQAVVIDHDVDLKQAAQIMSQRNIGCLIVMNKNNILGIISEEDVLKNISSLGKSISKAMSRKIVTISPEESLEDAAAIISRKKVKRLPVVNNGKLVGIVTATDLVANLEDVGEDFLLD